MYLVILGPRAGMDDQSRPHQSKTQTSWAKHNKYSTWLTRLKAFVIYWQKKENVLTMCVLG